MKTVIIVLVCVTILLGVLNTFWVKQGEDYLVAYVRRINLTEVFGTFTALEEYSRAMLTELQMITQSLDDLADTLRAFENVENVGDVLLAIVGLIGGLLYFLTSMVFHLCTIIVLHVYSIVQLVSGFCNLLLGL